MKKVILIKSRLVENNDVAGIFLDIEDFDMSVLPITYTGKPIKI